MNLHRAALALLLLCAAAPASRAAPANTRLAVLEFEVASDSSSHRTYFSDSARGAVHRAAPQVFVMTRESTEALLAANGKTMSDCTGECELEVGRKLGADWIVSGRITQVGSRLSLTMRLFSTADGQLVETAEARGRSADELLDHTDAAHGVLARPAGQPQRAPRRRRRQHQPLCVAIHASAPVSSPASASRAAPTASPAPSSSPPGPIAFSRANRLAGLQTATPPAQATAAPPSKAPAPTAASSAPAPSTRAAGEDTTSENEARRRRPSPRP